MKKILALILALVFLVACSAPAADQTVIRVGASPVPHGDILEAVKDDLKEKGFELKILEFTDYVQPNLALDEGDLEANFFQHKPYLDNFNEERGTKVVAVADIHIEPIGLYSSKYDSLDDLEDGALIIIPGDATNGGRSLVLLESLGLISLKEGTGIGATPQDIVDNPKNLDFKELEAAQIPRSLEDAGLAAINTNYALGAELDPRDALAQEEALDNPYANVIAVKEGQEGEDFVKALIEALQSDKVKSFLEEEYEGAILPAF